MNTALSRIIPMIIFWLIIGFSLALDRSLVGASRGWSVSLFVLPAAWTLGLRYGRGREEVKISILILMAVSEVASPLFPGVSAFLVGGWSLVGMWVGIRWTSIRLWWFHALIGSACSLVISLLARLMRAPMSLTSEMWVATLTTIPMTLLVYGAWMLIYARKRWYHEPF